MGVRHRRRRQGRPVSSSTRTVTARSTSPWWTLMRTGRRRPSSTATEATPRPSPALPGHEVSCTSTAFRVTNLMIDRRGRGQLPPSELIDDVMAARQLNQRDGDHQPPQSRRRHRAARGLGMTHGDRVGFVARAPPAQRIGASPATGQIQSQLQPAPLQIAYALLADSPTSRVRVPARGHPSAARTQRRHLRVVMIRGSPRVSNVPRRSRPHGHWPTGRAARSGRGPARP